MLLLFFVVLVSTMRLLLFLFLQSAKTCGVPLSADVSGAAALLLLAAGRGADGAAVVVLLLQLFFLLLRMQIKTCSVDAPPLHGLRPLDPRVG